jgi:hypothetical protein
MYAFLLLFLSILGLFPASVAYHKGYSFGLWWVYGALAFFVAFPHALLMHSKSYLIGDDLLPGEKLCPYCHESMPQEDDICPACHLHLYDPVLDGPAIKSGVARHHA